jgi:tRNA (adenine37-N6)-methyltransferase
MSPNTWEIIGSINSCFKEKFGIPRQAGLVQAATSILTLHPPFGSPESVRGLEGFSHMWVIFLFHSTTPGWRPTVRPPRLGGNRRVGVWASRSPFRPNPVGISAVKLSAMDRVDGLTRLHLEGGDFLDGTPVIDIKPYIRYADNIPDAVSGYANSPPIQRPVFFTDSARIICEEKERHEIKGLMRLISEVLQADPRPAYMDPTRQRPFGTRLYDLDIHWEVQDSEIWVTNIVDR